MPIIPDCFYESDMLSKEQFIANDGENEVQSKSTAAMNPRGKHVLNRPLRAASGVGWYYMGSRQCFVFVLDFAQTMGGSASCIEVYGVRSGRKHSCWKQRPLEAASTE
jgi:hypothetical protein